MTIDILLANFERLAEAPNGIKKLRELILQLAVRGKLVLQNPNDEPASELLKRIQAEKERLIAEGLIRKRKPLPSIKPEERLQELPASWEGVRLGKVGIMSPRNTACDNETAGFVPMSLVSDTFGSYPQNEERPWGEIKKGYTHFTNGDVVLAKITPCFENGKSGVMRALPNGFGAGTTELHVVRPIRGCMVPEYIWIFFKSPRFKGLGEAQMTGTAGQKRVPKTYVESSLLPLPPLAEQKRIVAKVDELMALCDELEAKQQAKRTKQIALNRASLHALTQPNGTNLGTAWHRVRDHFDDLYTVPETVTELRQTILQLAVMGRLVPQDPTDEPASELLKKIQAEKHRLIAEGSIRKSKPLPPIKPDETPYELPINWKWVRLGEVVDHRLGKMLDKQKNKGVPRPYLRNANVRWFGFDLSDLLTMRVEDDEFENVSVFAGDLVICEGGEPGRTAIWEKDEPIAIQKAIHRVRPLPGVFNRFVAYVMRSDTDSGRLEARFTGATIKHLTGRSLTVHVVPLPPFAEQKRIVTKIDQLMSLCDDLEAKLQQSETDADNLLSTIVHDLPARLLV